MRRVWRPTFFALLELDPREGHAASRAGVTPEYVSRLKARDPEFRAEIERRLAVFSSTSSAVAVRRRRYEIGAAKA